MKLRTLILIVVKRNIVPVPADGRTAAFYGLRICKGNGSTRIPATIPLGTKCQFTLLHHNLLCSVFKIKMNYNETAYQINLLFDSNSIRMSVFNLFG